MMIFNDSTKAIDPIMIKAKAEILKEGDRNCQHYEVITREGSNEFGICKRCGQVRKYSYPDIGKLRTNYSRIL